MSKLNSNLIFTFASQILLLTIAICTWLNGASLGGYIEEWGLAKVIAGAVMLSLAGVGIVFLLVRDAQKIEDEREDFIDLKAYRASFHIQTMAFLGLLIGNTLAPARSPVFIVVTVMIIAALSRVMALLYYRRTT